MAGEVFRLRMDMTSVEQSNKGVESTMQILINLAQNTSVSTFIINYSVSIIILLWVFKLIWFQSIVIHISSFYACFLTIESSI